MPMKSVDAGANIISIKISIETRENTTFSLNEMREVIKIWSCLYLQSSSSFIYKHWNLFFPIFKFPIYIIFTQS